jgi:hypothetical protein
VQGDILPTSIPPAEHKILCIGDSITSGWSDSNHIGSFTRGVDDAWPYAFARELQQRPSPVHADVEVVAHPWITLVDGADPDNELGMQTKFWHVRLALFRLCCGSIEATQAHTRDSGAKWMCSGDKSTVAFIALGEYALFAVDWFCDSDLTLL